MALAIGLGLDIAIASNEVAMVRDIAINIPTAHIAAAIEVLKFHYSQNYCYSCGHSFSDSYTYGAGGLRWL